MNLFCGGHVIYVGIARQGGTMRAYTPLVFIRAYTPLVSMHLYSVSLAYTPVVFMHLYSLSRAYTPLVFMHLYSLSLSHSTYSVAMMEFARLCRFAVCNKFLPLWVSMWDHFFVDTAGSRGGERVRARVADSSKSSLDQEASDDDGEQQSDDSSEALPAGECLYLSEWGDGDLCYRKEGGGRGRGQ